jgi:hypothetical protein
VEAERGRWAGLGLPECNGNRSSFTITIAGILCDSESALALSPATARVVGERWNGLAGHSLLLKGCAEENRAGDVGGETNGRAAWDG